VLFFAPPLVSTPAKLGRGLRTSQALGRIGNFP
jgi:hypothetical protein